VSQLNILTLEEPLLEPVSLQDVYEILRLDALGSPPSHPHDNILQNMVRAGREFAEARTRRALMPRLLKSIHPSFPKYRVLMSERGFGSSMGDDYEFRDAGLEIPLPPLIEVQRVEYFDENNTLQLLSPDDYYVVTESVVGQLRVNEFLAWPRTYGRPDAVQITYRAGYEVPGSPVLDPRAAVPSPLRQAILIHVQLQYDDVTIENRNALSALRDSMLEKYRVYTL
jgi:hypothetical protein